MRHVKRNTRSRSHLRGPRCRTRIRALARIPVGRTADVAENGGGLRARPAPVPRLPLRPSRRPGDAVGAVAACAARRARLSGRTARRRHRQPLADAHARGRALVRALSRAQRQGQGGRARRRAHAEDREDACRNRSRSPPPSAWPRPTCAPARSASPGFSPAMPRCSPCSTARACASPRRWASSAATFQRPGAATSSP